MSTPVVLIIANPFEARVVGRAVETAGLRAVVAEGGEGAVELLVEAAARTGDRAAVIVLAQALYYVDGSEVQGAIRRYAPGTPVLLIREGGAAHAEALPPEVTAVLARPINPSQLARQLVQLVSRAPAEPSSPSRIAATPVDHDAGAPGSDEATAVMRDVFAAVQQRADEEAAAEDSLTELEPEPLHAHHASGFLAVPPEPLHARQASGFLAVPPSPEAQADTGVDAEMAQAAVALVHSLGRVVRAGDEGLARAARVAGGPPEVDDSWWETEVTLPGEEPPSDDALPDAPPSRARSSSRAPRRALLRLDDAIGAELLAQGPPSPRRALDAHLAAVDRQLRRPEPADDLTLGDPEELGGRALPGLDDPMAPVAVPVAAAAVSRLGAQPTVPVAAAAAAVAAAATAAAVAPPAAAPAAAAPAVVAAAHAPSARPAQEHLPDLVGAALAVLVPSRDLALSRGTIASAEATPELDDRAGVADLADSGDLSRESVPELITRLHRAGYTGRLALRRGEAEKSIFFDGGFPVHATSSLPHDRLAEMLWREGRITREQHAQSRQFPGGGRRAIDFLIEIGALKRDETFKVMRNLVEELIYSCFGWDRGGWSVGRETAPRDEKVSIAHPYAVVLEGIRRKYPLERLVHAVGSPQTVVQGAPTLWRVSADAGLSTAERDAVQQLRRGPRTVHALRAAGRLDEIGAYALVHGLLVLGAVRPGEVAAAEAQEVEEPAAGGDEATVDRERALAKHTQVLDGDYFTVLGVSRGANAYEIRRAWERTRAAFTPERFEPVVRTELASCLDEIVEVIDEAWRALSDDRLRDTYRGHLAPPT